jgi:hypothetical protein
VATSLGNTQQKVICLEFYFDRHAADVLLGHVEGGVVGAVAKRHNSKDQREGAPGYRQRAFPLSAQAGRLACTRSGVYYHNTAEIKEEKK